MLFLPTTTLIPLVLLLSRLASASPIVVLRQAANATATTQLTFTGAGASFTVTAPIDGSTFQLPNPISVDHIAQAGVASCTFAGVDKAQLTVLGANTGATFAPPQTIVEGTCEAV